MREIVNRLHENKQIELAKSILEANGYTVTKKLKESGAESLYDIDLKKASSSTTVSMKSSNTPDLYLDAFSKLLPGVDQFWYMKSDSHYLDKEIFREVEDIIGRSSKKKDYEGFYLMKSPAGEHFITKGDSDEVYIPQVPTNK